MNDEEPSASLMKRLHSRIMAAGYQYHKFDVNSRRKEEEEEEVEVEEGNDSTGAKSRNSQTADCRLKVVSIVAFVIILALAIFIAWQHFEYRAVEVCTTPQCVQTSAYILAKMNLSQDPCSNFYEYSCGGWLDKTAFPPEDAKFGAFKDILIQNKHLLQKILVRDGDIYKGKNSTSVHKVKSFYKTCMDVDKLESIGLTPILKLIKKLGSWTITSDVDSGTWVASKWNFLQSLVQVFRHGSAFFSLSIGQDQKDSKTYIISFQQTGLTLAAREEYHGNTSQKYKDAFLQFTTETGTLLGGDNSTSLKMTAVYNFEKSLEELFVSKKILQDPVASYNRLTMAEFKTLLGDKMPFDIQEFVNLMFGRDIPATQHVIVYTVDYFKKLAALLNDTPKEVLANYMVWQVVQGLTGYMPVRFIDAVLKLSLVENGVGSVGPRWQRCVMKSTSSMAFATGALYAEKTFPPDSKKDALHVIEDVKAAFMANLRTVAWMDDKTRNIAMEKVKAVTDMIGYPEYIMHVDKLDKHYENLTIIDGEFFNSALSIIHWEKRTSLEKLWKPVDRNVWKMGPSDVNAYYSPTNNQIVFPAGILQKPFFDITFPLAFRYGSLGMIVGHELTHGFDNKGKNFDKDGNMRGWWTNSSEEAFKVKAQCIVDQYSRYTIQDTHLNGWYTLAENIADNGGLKTGYRAYQMAKKSADHPVTLPGLSLTADQLFYVGFSQIWCTSYTRQYALQTINTDQHANTKYRVLGSVSNDIHFAEAFKCPSGSPLNPSHKCNVW